MVWLELMNMKYNNIMDVKDFIGEKAEYDEEGRYEHFLDVSIDYTGDQGERLEACGILDKYEERFYTENNIKKLR